MAMNKPWNPTLLALVHVLGDSLSPGPASGQCGAASEDFTWPPGDLCVAPNTCGCLLSIKELVTIEVTNKEDGGRQWRSQDFNPVMSF
jgi:hypothetical protein